MASEKICFIISPIGEPNGETRRWSDEKYDLIFEPVLKELGYKPVRADKESGSTSISRTIVTRLINSELVIADTSESNANVFYELAIRNAAKKPVIIVKEPTQKLPFDIYDKRAISIDMKDNRQWTTVKEELKNHIIIAEKDPKSASESIVSEYAFDLAVGRTPNTEQEIFLMIKDLRDEVRSLRGERVQNITTSRPTMERNVFLISIERGSGAGIPKDMNQRLLSVETITIARGQTITWVNNDRNSHTITSGKITDDNAGSLFDSGLIKPDGIFSYTFNNSGVYPYFDTVHPWITGIIQVM